MSVESIGSLNLSTQTASFVGSFLCPGQTEQVVFSEGAGLIRHRREGPAHKQEGDELSRCPGKCVHPENRRGVGGGNLCAQETHCSL